MLNPDHLNRQTGRTTIIAFKALVEAMENPGKLIPLIDHHDTDIAHACLAMRVRDLIGTLEIHQGLGGFKVIVDKSHRHLEFRGQP